MRKFFLFSVLIFFLFFIEIGIVSACINITSPKSVYLPGETFQAEITGSFSQEPSVSNIYFFRNEEENLLYFNLIPISKEKYLIYMNLPSTTDESVGSWRLELKNIFCNEG
jgi:hypothetical protein